MAIVQQMEVASRQHGDLRKGQRALLSDAAHRAVGQHNGVIPVPRRQFLQNRAVLCLERFVTCRRVMHAFPKAVVLRVSRRQQQRRRVEIRDRAGLANAVIVAPGHTQLEIAHGRDVVVRFRVDGNDRTAEILLDFPGSPHHFRGTA